MGVEQDRGTKKGGFFCVFFFFFVFLARAYNGKR